MEPEDELYSVYEIQEYRGIRTEVLRCWDMTLVEAHHQARAQIDGPNKAIIREQTHRRLPLPNGGVET